MGTIPASDLLEQERSELDAVLASGAMAKALGQAKLLAYVCEAYFNGRGDQLKEYTLGTEVLGRPEDFDQTRDAIVRVEIYRLRKKLREYYRSEGASHALHIFLRPGQYVPSFVPREQSPYSTPESEAATNNVVAGWVELEATAEPEAAPVDASVVEAPLLGSPSDEQTAGPTPVVPLNAPASMPLNLIRWWRWLAVGIALIAMAGGLMVVAARSKRAVRATPAPSAVPAATEPPPGATSGGAPADGSVRIRAGYFKGSYVDRAGRVWGSDRYFSGGDALAQPRQYIARTLNPGMFQTMRSGQFSYDIPLAPGSYELHLYFTETHYGPDTLSGGGETSRLFDVSMNGQPLLHIFDIIKDAGGNNMADVRAFKDVHPAADGKLHLRFQSLIDAPILNAIEITPAPAGHINPIRIVAQENSYTDHAGHIWQPDQYARGGQFAVHLHRNPVSGTADPDLFVGERFGNFDYAIPVPPGRYSATLYFAETYWGTDNQRPGQALPDYRGSPEGGIGSRVFDVYGNGRVLLKDFDIFREAGGAGRALAKTFHDLEPDGEGKLVFSFVPQQDYACLNAIEIDDESR